ncbi:hypothetical protein BHE74_00006994 [Ensete ventricosum]|nr:hypothetical protein BHE74_00006994 [Ensete ventricosum]RZR83478.1 hypothetical protein BHM03_00010079 [Ensete ventricosum]
MRTPIGAVSASLLPKSIGNGRFRLSFAVVGRYVLVLGQTGLVPMRSSKPICCMRTDQKERGKDGRKMRRKKRRGWEGKDGDEEERRRLLLAVNY